VVAGYQKLMNFSGAPGSTVDIMSGLGLPLPTLVAILVIIIEIPVALAFAWGYRVCVMGSILSAFTVLTILLVHRDFSNQLNMIMVLKNIAIIGGIMATISGCNCEKCKVK
jgi:putative oxidoreductase